MDVWFVFSEDGAPIRAFLDPSDAWAFAEESPLAREVRINVDKDAPSNVGDGTDTAGVGWSPAA